MIGENSFIPYIDTSALAKRYLSEDFSDAFDAYLGEFSWVAISSLTLVEMHCHRVLATADRSMAAAAEAMSLKVQEFFAA